MQKQPNFLHELVGSMSQGAAGNPTVAMIEAVAAGTISEFPAWLCDIFTRLRSSFLTVKYR